MTNIGNDYDVRYSKATTQDMQTAAKPHTNPNPLAPTDTFAHRHIGPSDDEITAMLARLGVETLDELCAQTIPADVRMNGELALGEPRGEHEVILELRAMADRNRIFRSFLGMGYHATITPPVVLRNILENPGWYTQYTPYQSEISQGRLEALLNFQTMVCDLTGLPTANASLLDEATAAAEAMTMCYAHARGKKPGFFVSDGCHPQTIAVVVSRAEPLGIRVHVGPLERIDFEGQELCGALAQYPDTRGQLHDYRALTAAARAAGACVVAAADLLALTLAMPPGEWGADIAIGSAQRFGVPMGYGGPHAAFMACRDELKRQMPGRIVGVSVNAEGRRALRLALQTREQHIRRERATSNICTAQVLLAIMASMYAVYHGPEGLRAIARRIRRATNALAEGLRRLGFAPAGGARFDTLYVPCDETRREAIIAAAAERCINLRRFEDGGIGIALDETVELDDLRLTLESFAGGRGLEFDVAALAAEAGDEIDAAFARSSEFMTHPVFHTHRSETEMLRYITKLQSRDLSLANSMIPLGSCTMKLNAVSEMLPVTWPEFARLHPFAPPEQALGYAKMFEQLERWLAEITGFSAVSLQPNAGSQGEYAGLLTIRAWHRARGEAHRDVCLIPVSAHGTNPASAAMAGMRVVTVACDEQGNIDVDDLRAKVERHAGELAALMLTYPSTHGVFESGVREFCEIVHARGGQVYLDGANMNAQVGLCRPGDYGADVCHLNLHKTFCIPHGGGGPGMGPICCAAHLAPYLPGHPLVACGGASAIGPVAAAPWGSPSILPIPWVYIALMGGSGLKKASQVAILNANYMTARLREHYDVLYAGRDGRVAHEFIIDCRDFKKSADIAVEDIAKRLMDYGFHAPTMSWPVAGTLMIEPTESESKDELDRLCDALIAIRGEIAEIEAAEADRDDNALKNAPHTMAMVTADEWTHPYPRSRAAWPAAWLREAKFWPTVARVDNAYGDRNFMCSCPPVEELAEG